MLETLRFEDESNDYEYEIDLKLEWFSFECRKTKTKVITLANHIGHRQYLNQSKLEVITCGWRKARENACERVTIGFGFTSD